MLERSEYPPGVPCWVDTAQPDPEAAARFYGGLFGWEFEDQMPSDAPGNYFMARLHGRDVAAVGSQPDGAPPTPVWSTYIAVDSADDAAAEITKAGGSTLAEPFDIFDSGRMGWFTDPEGAGFGVWQPNQHRGAAVVNEPGSLAGVHRLQLGVRLVQPLQRSDPEEHTVLAGTEERDGRTHEVVDLHGVYMIGRCDLAGKCQMPIQ